LKKAVTAAKQAVSPRVLAFCVMVVCLVATLGVTAANLRLTYVTDSNGARQVLLTDADASPAQVMHLSGIRSEEGDEVYYTAFSGNLASLNIERAFSVSITADGQEYPVKLVFGTVADALERAGITLEGDDYTEPALDHVVTAGSKIVVHRVDYAERVETQAIPYDTQYVYTSLYFRNTGRTTTVQHGAAGQQTVTTRDRYVDGELENSTGGDTTTTADLPPPGGAPPPPMAMTISENSSPGSGRICHAPMISTASVTPANRKTAPMMVQRTAMFLCHSFALFCSAVGTSCPGKGGVLGMGAGSGSAR